MMSTRMLLAMALLVVGSSEAKAQSCRECDFGQVIPCTTSESGATYCDDTSPGECILVGPECGGTNLASAARLSLDGSYKFAAGAANLLAGEIVDDVSAYVGIIQRPCDELIVARAYDRHAAADLRRRARMISFID